MTSRHDFLANPRLVSKKRERAQLDQQGQDKQRVVVTGFLTFFAPPSRRFLSPPLSTRGHEARFYTMVSPSIVLPFLHHLCAHPGECEILLEM